MRLRTDHAPSAAHGTDGKSKSFGGKSRIDEGQVVTLMAGRIAAPQDQAAGWAHLNRVNPEPGALTLSGQF